MSWDVEFEARPLRLKLIRRSQPGKAKRYVYLTVPDAVYRKVTRRVVTRLLEENAALRRDYRRPPSNFARALVWAMRRALKERE